MQTGIFHARPGLLWVRIQGEIWLLVRHGVLERRPTVTMAVVAMMIRHSTALCLTCYTGTLHKVDWMHWRRDEDLEGLAPYGTFARAPPPAGISTLGAVCVGSLHLCTCGHPPADNRGSQQLPVPRHPWGTGQACKHRSAMPQRSDQCFSRRSTPASTSAGVELRQLTRNEIEELRRFVSSPPPAVRRCLELVYITLNVAQLQVGDP